MPFWLVVLILKFSSIQQFCEGTSCTLSIIIGVVGIIILCVTARPLEEGVTLANSKRYSIVVVYVAVISWMDWLHFRKHGVARGTPVEGTPGYAEAYYANAARK